MSWLTDFVRPKIQKLVRQKETPDNLWDKCPKCEQMIFHRELQENLQVCKHCQHHLRLSAKERLASLFDQGDYVRLASAGVPQDPLHFKDSKRYSDRLKDARHKTGEEDALIAAHGKIAGVQAMVAVFDFTFIGGSMGIAVGETFIQAAQTACRLKIPMVVVPASGGARMQEGILALMQMPRSVLAVSLLKEAKLPYITLLTDPTTGGVSASFASLGDITLAEQGAIIGFTGARVIQETLRTPLPNGFQSAEFQMEHGFVDLVVHRHDLKETLANILKLLQVSRVKASFQKVRPTLGTSTWVAEGRGA
ncbi:MAG: acetyl-CoA carboxylase, carboxyltransferase subunit beta [Alphaproteobacteria bacterium]